MMDCRCCGTCLWWTENLIDRDNYCQNENSRYFGDLKEADDICEEWEE